MRKKEIIYFVKNGFVFSLIFCILVVLFILFTQYLFNHAHEILLSRHNNLLFIGDSHIKEDIREAFIENSINIATRSESIYYSYFKIKKILEIKNNIKTICMGFNYHSISQYYDENLKVDKYIKRDLGRFFFYFPVRMQKKIIYKYFFQLPDLIRNMYAKNISFIIRIFNKSHKEKKHGAEIIYINARLKKQFYNQGFSDINIEYLLKIYAMCKEKKIKLILIHTPLHHYYRVNVPKKFIEKYKSIVNNNKLELFDYSNLNLTDDCYLPDGDHLSTKGAKILSKKINNAINLQVKDL